MKNLLLLNSRHYHYHGMVFIFYFDHIYRVSPGNGNFNLVNSFFSWTLHLIKKKQKENDLSMTNWLNHSKPFFFIKSLKVQIQYIYFSFINKMKFFFCVCVGVICVCVCVENWKIWSPGRACLLTIHHVFFFSFTTRQFEILTWNFFSIFNLRQNVHTDTQTSLSYELNGKRKLNFIKTIHSML